LLKLGVKQAGLLGLKPLLDLLHLNVVLEVLVILITLLLPLEFLMVILGDTLGVIGVHEVLLLRFVHNLVQALRQRELLKVLLINLLLAQLGLSDLGQVVLLPPKQGTGLLPGVGELPPTIH
jgi:hypothetical protein